MLHDKRSRRTRHARISLAALGFAATVAAAVVAATAVPALANGSHGNSAAHSQSASHSRSSTAPNGKSATAHANKGTHGKSSTAHATKGTHGKSGTAHSNKGTHGSSGSRGNSANAHEHVTICHATPPDTAANGYVRISPSAAGVYNGHLKEHAADIIPPFTYSGQTYSLNWDATGQAIWNNGCAVPSSSTSGGTNGESHGKGHGKGHDKGGGKGGSRGNSGNAHEHVTICHATPPDTAANGYVMISPSASGVYHGHLKEHAADIIPPFLYSGLTYSLNWDATGQAIFNNGCVAPSTSSTGASTHSSRSEKAQVAAAAKAAFKAMVAALKPASAKKTGGVLGAHKTLKRVTHHTRAARAVTRSASFTG
jgi:hypothetical protein